MPIAQEKHPQTSGDIEPNHPQTVCAPSQHELEQFAYFWDLHITELRERCPDAVLVYILGNHERRLYAYAENKAPAVRKTLMKRFREIVEHDGDVLWIGATDYVRMGPLVVMHGNRHNIYAARATLEDMQGQVSVIFGHIHRLDAAVRQGEDFTVGAYASGCLQRGPHYVKYRRPRRKEQLGTAIAYVDLNGRDVQVDNLKFEEERGRHRRSLGVCALPGGLEGWSVYQILADVTV